MKLAFASALAAAIGGALTAGCAAAPPPPPLTSLIASGQYMAVCNRVGYVSGDRDPASALHEAREGAALLSRQYRVTVLLSVETLESANKELGRPLLDGEIAPLAASVQSEGPMLDEITMDIAAREDGARWESIVKQRTLHDTLRVLFGAREGKLPPDDQRTTRSGRGLQHDYEEWRYASERLEKRNEGCRHPGGTMCSRWAPLARAAPSLGPDELLLSVAYWLKDSKDRCRFERLYAVPLPPGASLVERLTALAARGPMVLGE
jgi:hypothetical protein